MNATVGWWTRLAMLVVALGAIGASAPAWAQSLVLPVASPRAEVMQNVGVIEVRVNYSSPGKKGRTVWGELVPYGKLWRTGANAATTLETSGELTIGGATVPAGKYSVFSIPDKDQWTLILNKNADQSNVGDYDQALDVVRVLVKPEAGAARERMTFLFSDTTDTTTRLDLEWDGLRVSLPIAVDTSKMVTAGIDTYTESVSQELSSAARYALEHGEYDRAIELADKSLTFEESWVSLWLKASALHEKGDNKEAYRLASRANELGLAAGEDQYFWKERVEKALKEWKKK